MSDAYCHKGLTIEFDVSVPRLTIEGREIPSERLTRLFDLSEPDSVKAEKLRQCGKDIIEGSPGFKKREATRLGHLAILARGVPEWNRWRTENPEIRPLLYESDLTRATLLVDLNEVDFANAVLINADLRAQQLKGANFHEANLARAKLHKADLTGANFCRTDLYETQLPDAILNDANLQGTQLAKTNFEGAKLIGCKVYGMSAWDLRLDRAEQRNLIIRYREKGEDEHDAVSKEAEITVDDLEVAQFIYLLLNNKKIRNVIDTVTSRVILILGRFTEERKRVLEAIRLALTARGYVPILFDFQPSPSRDLTETVMTLASMAKFVVADITDPKSIPQELSHIIPHLPSVPVQPILLASRWEYGMFEHWRSYPWLLPEFLYQSEQHLLANLDAHVIAPSETRRAGEIGMRTLRQENEELRRRLAEMSRQDDKRKE